MNLVIVESPAKAKTINKYLGKGYLVKASKGHVVDLPKSEIGVDVENNFKPNYVVTKNESLKELKKAFKDASKLVLAVDLDREGEAIGWHIAQKLGAIDAKGKKKGKKDVVRIVFSEITKDAIQEAIQNPREINMDLVNAQQARRVLDRLVGYKLSPVLWKKISFGLSAGRVQSVALRLIVEKEEERNKFDSKEFWKVYVVASKKMAKNVEVKILEKGTDNARAELEPDATFNIAELKKSDDAVIFELAKIEGKKFEPGKKTEVEDIIEILKSKEIVIKSVDTKNVKKYPKPPFITSTFQQAAVNTLGMSASNAMRIAQKLYEAGFITYMRTDSLAISNQAINQIRNFVDKKFGKKYLPSQPNFYKSKSKNSQEAHECIRPVDINVEEDKSFTPEQKKVYRLIRNKTLASQMTPAELEQMSIEADCGKLGLKATGSKVIFDGFLRVMRATMEDVILPKVEVGEKYFAENIQAKQGFTQPPARYSEASLIKKLEELEIGRPSTYASIISTIQTRRYVEKEGRYLKPTDTGVMVNKLLVKYFDNIVDYQFTSEMEEDLDDVADGKLDWVKMLKDFYKPFEKEVKEKEKEIPREEFTVIGKAPSDIKCPVCGSKMDIKLGRFGRFYSCSKWPECKGILSVDGTSKEELEKEVETKEFKESYLPSPKTEDGRDYILKAGKFGKFWAHPDYPKVKDAQPLIYTPEKEKEIFGIAPKTKNGKNFLLRSGKFGHFWAHPDYPKVKEVVRIKKKPDQNSNK